MKITERFTADALVRNVLNSKTVVQFSAAINDSNNKKEEDLLF